MKKFFKFWVLSVMLMTVSAFVIVGSLLLLLAAKIASELFLNKTSVRLSLATNAVLDFGNKVFDYAWKLRDESV